MAISNKFIVFCFNSIQFIYLTIWNKIFIHFPTLLIIYSIISKISRLVKDNAGEYSILNFNYYDSQK